jgi:hemolysin activation/secretion protein
MVSPRVGPGSRGCLAFVATALTSSLALAQPVSPPAPTPQTAPELDPSARLPRPPPRPSGDVFAPEPPGPCPLADSDVEVTLTSVEFRGASALTAAELREAYAGELNRPQKVAVICAIRDRAARMIFDRGVLARVEIPEQRISGGALVLEVVEAHVVNVRVRGDIGPGQAAVERYVEKLRGMKPFDMQKAQRYLLLASDVPGVRARAAVRPSTSSERGAVDIDVTVSRDAVDVIANVQNLGSETVGRWGGLVRGELYSATQYGETTSITLFRTIEANEQWLVQAAVSGRFGSEGLTARGSLVYGESHPGGVLEPLDLESRSFVANVEAAYPLVRLRRQNLNLAGGLDWVDQRTDALGQKFNDDQLRVLYVRADGDYRTEALGQPVLLNGGLSVRKGIDAFGASDAGAAFLSRANAKPDGWLIRGFGAAETALGERFTAAARVQAQYSPDPLLPYEQISLGNLTVGRGYDPAASLGDSGVSGAFELRYAGWQLHPLLGAVPYVFYDHGWVRNNEAALSGLLRSRTLRSVGAGVVMRIAGRANLELTYAKGLDSPLPGAGKPDSRLLVQLTASLK